MLKLASLIIARAGTVLTRARLLIVLITLFGLALRLLNLEQLGNFDFDEVASFHYAEQSLGDMLRTVTARSFEHPPLYYVLLHFWFWLPLERSEAFVRFLSVVFGMLTIPAAYLLALQVLQKERAACFAAFLVALMPLEIFLSREARMYTLLALLATLSLWLLLQAIARGRWWWIAYASVTLLALYTHYISVAILLAENVYLIWVLRQDMRRLARIVAVEFVVALAHLPWIGMATGIQVMVPAIGTGSWSRAYIVSIIESTWLHFAVGPVARSFWVFPIAAIVWLVALLGILARPLRRRESLLLAALLLCTIAAIAALIVIDRPFRVRYIFMLHVPFLILVAAGLERLQSWRWWLAAGGLAAIVSLPLIPYFAGYQRGDYERITQRVERLAIDGDEVILTGPWQEWFWCHYAARKNVRPVTTASLASGCLHVPEYDIFVHRIPLAVPPALDPEQTDKDLRFIYTEHKPKRLWFVQAGLEWADPTNFVERWLTENAWRGYRQAYRNGVLSLWAVEERAMTRVTPEVMTVGDTLAVDWYELEENPQSGSIIRVTFGLRLLKKTDKNIKLSFRLSDGRGEFIQRDVFVGHPHRPTSTWVVGESVVFRTGILLPPGAKPGIYALGSIFYVDFTPPFPVFVSGSARPNIPYALGEVEVQRNPPEVVDPDVTPNQTSVQFADPDKQSDRQMVGLEGYGIADTTVRPGERLQVLLVWRALREIDTQLHAEFRLTDALGTVAWEYQQVIGGETYRVDRWIVNDFVRDWYATVLAATLPDGEYALNLRVLKQSGRDTANPTALVIDTENDASVSLGKIRVKSQVDLIDLFQRGLERVWRRVAG